MHGVTSAIDESSYGETCGNKNGVIDLVISNANYSGDLPATLSPTVSVDNAHTVHTQVSSDQFVQVATQGSVDVLSPAPMHMVGNQLPSFINYTSTNPTVGKQLNDIDVNVITLQEASINPNSVASLPLISILPSQTDIQDPQLHAATGNSGPVYILTMAVESDTDNEVKEDGKMSCVLNEVRIASTPKKEKEESVVVLDLNETIFAGNLHQDKVTTKATSNNNENVEPACQPDTATAHGPDTAAGLKACRQIQIPATNVQSAHSDHENKPHNETYCKDWVSKINQVINPLDPNGTLAQGDISVENISFGLSSLNITSISRNKTSEYSQNNNKKFVSQKKKNTSLPKKKN